MPSVHPALTIALAAAISIPALTQAQDTIPSPVSDVTSYALGLQIGSNLRRQGFEENDLDGKSFAQGLIDVLSGGKPKISDQQIQTALQAIDAKLQQRMEAAVRKQQAAQEELAGPNLARAKAFLAENAKKPGVVTLPSGLQYKVIEKGTGDSPKVSSEVLAHYTGRKPNEGPVFDSSVQRGSPMKFVPRDMIAGWAEAIPKMKVGSKWILFVPPELAYGTRGTRSPSPGTPPVIGPNEALEFEVELIKIVRP